MKAYDKDILRAIKKGRKRFLSLMLITALGVTTMTGLRAACSDLRYSADEFFDKQGLFDVNVVSTLGLTDDDVEALSNVDGVETAEGIYREQVYIRDEGESQSVQMTVLSEKGINIPYILEGRLPRESDEIAVIEKYAINTGKTVGDTVIIEEKTEQKEDNENNSLKEEEKPNFLKNTFTITGVVTDVKDVNKSDGAASFRTASSSDYTFFVTKDAVKADIFTDIYLKLAGTKELQTYSAEYENKVRAVTEEIESQIKEKREQARYNEVVGEARDKIDETEAEMNDEFAKADEEFANAWADINDGKSKLKKGLKELEDKERQANSSFEKAWAEIEKGYDEIEKGRKQLAESENQLADGEEKLKEAREELKQKQDKTTGMLAASKSQIEKNKNQAENEYKKLNTQTQQITGMLGAGFPDKQCKKLTEAAKNAYANVVSAKAQVSQLEQQLESVDEGSSEYGEIKKKLEAAKKSQSQAEAAVPGDIAPYQKEFVTAVTPVVTNAVAGTDAKIDALDNTAADYDIKLKKLQAQKAQLQALPTELPKAAVALGQLQGTTTVLTGQLKELEKQQQEAEKGFADGWKQIAEKEKELTEGKSKLNGGLAELEQGSKELAAGKTELEAREASARQQIEEGRQTISRNSKELEEGEAELRGREIEYIQERTNAEQELADAKKELEDIDTAKWYVQDRSSLGGYANIDTDSASIEALGTVFPIVFLIVAVLISLTAITRKVEEERGLIGTYKALGFTNREIRLKYTLFAFAASLLGGIIGDLCGFVLLPKIIFSIFDIMYSLPGFIIKFDFLYGIIGIVLFVVCIVAATVFACSNELRQMPAVLMRPKAPKAGSRVLLERIPFIWNRFSFLNKVTARNLFRYKKRLFMTVLGIMGCTALLVCGFAIKDSVTELLPNQYEWIYRYDLQAVANDKDNSSLIEGLDADEKVEEFINLRMETAKIKNSDGKEDSLQIMVMPEGISYDSFMYLENVDGEEISLDKDGAYLTENAARMLGISKGDRVALQDIELAEREVVVKDIIKNYLGNKVYMSQSTYEAVFGEYKPNTVLVNFKDTFNDHEAYAEMLGDKEGVMSSISMVAIKKDFAKSFSLVNVAVYIIISLAAGLAVVVLFTLSTTNISERERELATIKVLGFYDREVHSYVNKETLILTCIGILLGLPVGQYLGGLLTNALKMPAVHFAVTIYPISYVYSAGIALIFAVLVNLITNRILNKIDPVEALKSVE